MPTYDRYWKNLSSGGLLCRPEGYDALGSTLTLGSNSNLDTRMLVLCVVPVDKLGKLSSSLPVRLPCCP